MVRPSITTLLFGTGALLLAGCGLTVPNGVFSCVSSLDCPSGFSCWNSDGRCYDTKEPENVCVQDSCEQVIAQFAAIGVAVECGTLPDGCDGIVECPPCAEGQTCGANGRSFQCGCEPKTCSSVEAQCGSVTVGCGSDEVIDCGQCPGQFVCEANRCVCPAGQNCDEECGACGAGELCVNGECCPFVAPCSQHECSPPGVPLPDGCGGEVVCSGCGPEATCVLNPSSQLFECQEDCSCDAQGIECGTATICGISQLCGVCDASVPFCADGRCVCVDPHESNDSPSEAAPLDCGASCKLSAVQVELAGTLDDKDDYDFYRIEVANSGSYAVRIDVSDLQSTRQIFLTYVCPNGSASITDCSGSSGSFQDSKYCVEDGSDSLRLVHDCEGSGTATIIAGVSAKEGEFKGPCDTYSLTVSSVPYDD